MQEKDEAIEQLADYYGVSREELARIRAEVDREMKEEDEDESFVDCAEHEGDERLSVQTFL